MKNCKIIFKFSILTFGILKKLLIEQIGETGGCCWFTLDRSVCSIRGGFTFHKCIQILEIQTSFSAPGQLEAQFPHSPMKRKVEMEARLVWFDKLKLWIAHSNLKETKIQECPNKKSQFFSNTVDMEAKNVGASWAPWLRESSSCGARVVNLKVKISSHWILNLIIILGLCR